MGEVRKWVFTGAGVEIIEAAGGSGYMVGKTGVGAQCASAVGNAARLFVWKKGRQIRKGVVWGLQHAWAHMINSKHLLEKAVRILSACEKAFFHATICILYLIGYN
jgi:hypothetical protein